MPACPSVYRPEGDASKIQAPFWPPYDSQFLWRRYGTFVRLGFANVDRSFIEIDLVRNFPIRPLADQAMGFPPREVLRSPLHLVQKMHQACRACQGIATPLRALNPTTHHLSAVLRGVMQVVEVGPVPRHTSVMLRATFSSGSQILLRRHMRKPPSCPRVVKLPMQGLLKKNGWVK